MIDILVSAPSASGHLENLEQPYSQLPQIRLDLIGRMTIYNVRFEQTVVWAATHTADCE